MAENKKESGIDGEIQAKGCVWHSNARQPRHVIGSTCELANNEAAYLRHLSLYNRGEMAARSDLPNRMWIADDASRHSRAQKTLPDTFTAGCYFVVSQSVAVVLERFDLGSSALLPVTMMKEGNQEPFGGSYYIFHATEKKPAFEAERSRNYGKPLYEDDTHLGSVKARTNDDDLVLRSTVFDGVDVWTDPLLLTSLMFSDALYQALAAEDLLSNAGNLRCLVV